MRGGRFIARLSRIVAGLMLLTPLLAVTPAHAQQQLVKISSEIPSQMVRVNNTTFFSGSHLWKTDGTAAGTIMISTLQPIDIIGAGNTLYFNVPDGNPNSFQLWKTDGTVAGTAIVASNMFIAPGGMTSLNGVLYFAGSAEVDSGGNVTNIELWKTDGTVSGTQQVTAINPGIGSVGGRTTYATIGNELFFRANDGVHGSELWKTDGTAAGTAMVADINTTGSSNPSAFIQADGRFYFDAQASGDPDLTVWTSDGTTAGTSKLTDRRMGIFAKRFGAGAMVGNRLFFAATPVDASGTADIWQSDGTAASTHSVDASRHIFGAATSFVNYNDKLFFLGFDYNTQPHLGGLWQSDGTVAGTQQVLQSAINADSGTIAASSPIAIANGSLYYLVAQSNLGSDFDLWKSNGTIASTARVTTTNTVNHIMGVTAYNDVVYLTQSNGDGTGGTWRVVDSLPAPANLHAASPAKQPALAWDTVAGTDHYSVYRDGALVGSSATASFTDTTAPDGLHSYYVTAVEGGGLASDPSNTVSVVVDTGAPTISAAVSPTPNTAGWNKANATVTFTCSDAGSGVASCPSPVSVTNETAGQIVSRTATDNAGNTATSSVTVKLDKTMPTGSGMTLAPTLVLFTGTLSISANATDTLSGITGGEYYIDTDPGIGNGTAMAYGAGKITATRTVTLGSLTIGPHTVFVRSKDAAGNWSTTVSMSFIYV